MIDSPRAAVLLFCGDARRDESDKRLPRRFLGMVHRSLRRVVESAGRADLVTVANSRRGMVMTSGDLRHESEAASLAERIDDAIRFCFASGYQGVIILAADIIGLSRRIILDALEHLDCSEPTFVLGASGDGGFYLAGFNRAPRFAWRDIVERRDRAAAMLLDAASANRFNVERVADIDDVDNYADAMRLLGRAGEALVRALISLLLFHVPAPRPILHSCIPRRRGTEPLRGPPPALVLA